MAFMTASTPKTTFSKMLYLIALKQKQKRCSGSSEMVVHNVAQRRIQFTVFDVLPVHKGNILGYGMYAFRDMYSGFTCSLNRRPDSSADSSD